MTKKSKTDIKEATKRVVIDHNKQMLYRKVFSKLRKTVSDLEKLAEAGENVDTTIGDVKRIMDSLHIENFRRVHHKKIKELKLFTDE